MIDKNIQLTYKYILTGKQNYLFELLVDIDGTKFANQYFIGELRQKCIDYIGNTPLLRRAFEDQAYFIDKYVDRKYRKGCFSRV
jgi:hypothetical protein